MIAGHGPLGAADRVRDKCGEASVVLGGGRSSKFREKTHENPGVYTDESENRTKSLSLMIGSVPRVARFRRAHLGWGYAAFSVVNEVICSP